MTIREVTVEQVKQYAIIDHNEDDALIRDILMPAAKAHIMEYTGLTEDDLRLLRRLLTQIYQNALEATHGPCSTPICDPLPSTPTIEEGEHTHG